MMSCATLSRKLMDRVHCRTDGLMVLSDTFFETLACVAAVETEMKNGMQSTKAIHARRSICFYFTANGSGRLLITNQRLATLDWNTGNESHEPEADRYRAGGGDRRNGPSV